MTAEVPIGIELHRHDSAAAAAMLHTLGDVYAEVRAEPPYDTDPLWRREAFLARTEKQVRDAGFVLLTAHADSEIAGFAFGRPLARGRWFEGDSTPPDEVLAATKFSVIELNVRKQWRNRGIGRALLDQLLAGRAEEYGMLSTLPHSAARPMYQRWGWRQVATTLPDSGFPPMDTLVLPLKPSA